VEACEAWRFLVGRAMCVRDQAFCLIDSGGSLEVKITGVDVCPLTGATVDGGWPQGHEPQENLHTLVIVHTDSGLSGFGSCFTSGRLIAGAVELCISQPSGRVVVDP